MLGSIFDYAYLLADGSRGGGGIMVAWRRDRWAETCVVLSTHGIKILFTCQGSELPWWLVSVYDPQLDAKKTVFLDELRNLRPI
jgi:hypothetical protein